MKKVISTQDAPLAIGAYSQAVLVDGILYISGQIPINPENGNLVEEIEEETHQVMKNLKAILHEAGLDFSNVVKTSIFLTDMKNFPLVNDIYSSYFSNDDYPARETIQVAALPKGVSVEISMISHTKIYL